MTTTTDTNRQNDQAYMQRVLELAALGESSSFPNPRVGCVLVNNGEIVAEAYHQIAGDLHAERLALQQAGAAARGATAYVNLEPCCHQGRTPPCTDGLIDAGVVKVVAAMTDPNPLVAGGGFEQLKMAGVEVEQGVLQNEALWLNRGFVKRMRHKQPWVILKSAATLDGRTAAHDGTSKWITGDEARQQVQQLRSVCSAIITGIDTVLADDPEMNVRLPETTVQPLRVILDTDLRLPTAARIIGYDQRALIFTLSQDDEKIAALTELGAEVVQQKSDSGRLQLDQVLRELAKWDCNEVLVEAGQTLSGAFMESGLVDELQLFYAGTLLGDAGRSMFRFDAPLPFAERFEYHINDVSKIGADIKVTAVCPDSLAGLQ